MKCGVNAEFFLVAEVSPFGGGFDLRSAQTTRLQSFSVTVGALEEERRNKKQEKSN